MPKKAENKEPIESAPEAPADRFEEYDAVKPDGEVVHIRRNIETGETEIVK